MKNTFFLTFFLFLAGWGLGLEESSFQNPAQEDRPETWFHFIGGNVNARGVTADLEAIKAAGISGVQFFHGQFGGAWPGVEPQIACLSSSWDGLVGFLGEECARLGLSFKMQNCPGWAMSGGPWIAPSNAMRNLVYSRVDVRGGQDLSLVLPQPQPSQEDWRDYRDIAVLAFPTPLGDENAPLTPQSVSSPFWEGAFNGKGLSLATVEGTNAPHCMEFTFAHPVTVRSVEIPPPSIMNHAFSYTPDMLVTVEALTAAGAVTVAREQIPQGNWQDAVPLTIACDDAVAATWRMTFKNGHPMKIPSIRLFSAARENNWEGLAAWTLRGLSRRPHPCQARSAWIDSSSVLNLTACMTPDGSLNWTVPRGAYTVLRVGHVNTGRKNGPAPKEGTGWECDKLSASGAETHFAGYIGRLNNGPLSGGKLKGLLMDSWECERQTWTTGLDASFESLRGYPLLRWLPAVFGWVMDDPETTERFLIDWRRTISDLCIKNYYGKMAELAHREGLMIQYETAFGDVFPGDLMEFWKYADTPMCEFWQPHGIGFVGDFNFKPVRPCVSAARMYGKRRVAAEAFTSFTLTWDEKLRMLKDVANMHLARGVTHLVFHTYTHNPRTDWKMPGTSFGSKIGTPFLRGQTWWKHMPGFTEYFARCGMMLEAGKPVSDVLWYLGDEIGHKPLEDVSFPAGYQYDYCNPDALLTRIRVKDGLWSTPDGITYRALWLPDVRRMRTDTLDRVLSLVRDGGVAIFDRLPEGPATLGGGKENLLRFTALTQAIWEKGEENGVRRLGKGRVYIGRSLDDVLRMEKVSPDVRGGGVRWLHRTDGEKDWYFVCAESPHGFCGTQEFRADGDVSIWNPETGKVSSAPAASRKDGRTKIALELAPSDACFIVFDRRKEPVPRVERIEYEGKVVLDLTRDPGGSVASSHIFSMLEGGRSFTGWQKGVYRVTLSDGSRFEKKTSDAVCRLTLTGPWNVTFPDGWSMHESYSMNPLIPWKEVNGLPAARAFSGTAKYTISFMQRDAVPGERFQLNLGRVESIASVMVNGREVQTLWAEPYRLDITRFVKPGINTLAISVTDTWYNRLVFDAGLPEAERKTWTISGPSKDNSLLDSGLLGPVVLSIGETVDGATKK